MSKKKINTDRQCSSVFKLTTEACNGRHLYTLKPLCKYSHCQSRDKSDIYRLNNLFSVYYRFISC